MQALHEAKMEIPKVHEVYDGNHQEGTPLPLHKVQEALDELVQDLHHLPHRKVYPEFDPEWPPVVERGTTKPEADLESLEIPPPPAKPVFQNSAANMYFYKNPK